MLHRGSPAGLTPPPESVAEQTSCVWGKGDVSLLGFPGRDGRERFEFGAELGFELRVSVNSMVIWNRVDLEWEGRE
jgi:hypothetical protein